MEIKDRIKTATELIHKICDELHFMDEDDLIPTLKSEEMDSLFEAFYRLKYFIYGPFDDD